MKVKDLIKQLQSFDPEKDIWVLYDFYELQEPDFLSWNNDLISTLNLSDNFNLNSGDYVHIAY